MLGGVGREHVPLMRRHAPLVAATPLNAQQAQMITTPKNPKLYKTELCRSWMDYGRCNYGDRCQYAHGEHEKRPVPRHPKYKTEYCQSYHQSGYCPYGPRCHFIHNEQDPAVIQGTGMITHTTQRPNELMVQLAPGGIATTPTVNAGCGSAGESPVPSSADSGSDSPTTTGSFSPVLLIDADEINSCLLARREMPRFDWAAAWSSGPATPSTSLGSSSSSVIDLLAWQFEDKTSLLDDPPCCGAPGRLPVFARLSNASSN